MTQYETKLRVGIIGATGYVGQRFILLLADHPQFQVTLLAASARSAGKPYADVMKDRWKMESAIPEGIGEMVVRDADKIEAYADDIDFVFCAVDMEKQALIALEERIARLEIPVVSNNSANRMTPDVPMIMPEVNPDHSAIIASQKKRLGTTRGFIAVKPNCSIQSYVPALAPLTRFKPTDVIVATYQAVSGAGKLLTEWPEMSRNVIPFIGGEDAKSENEPLKIWGRVQGDKIVSAEAPCISAQCYRVPVQEGHLAAVSVKFAEPVSREEILAAWAEYKPLPQQLGLPSAPQPFLTYMEDDDRPQPRLDADSAGGMGISLGRLRPDPVLDWKFVGLSHNTVRGAAGGAVLMAELLVSQGYIEKK